LAGQSSAAREGSQEGKRWKGRGEARRTQIAMEVALAAAPSAAPPAAPAAEQDDAAVAAERHAKLMRSLSLLRDGLGAAQPAVSAGFSAAELGTDLGFLLARLGVQAPFQMGSWLVGGSAEQAQGAASPITSILDLAHLITRGSLAASRGITEASLAASDGALELGGAEKGETLRVLQEHVAAQAGTDGHAVREALLGLCVLLVELGGRLEVADPMLLLRGARQLALLHASRRAARVASERSAPLPRGPELEQLSRMMRFAAAAYGWQACHFLGIVPASGRLGMTSDRACVVQLCGLARDEDVLLVEQAGELYRPGHLVVLCRERRQVVVAVRGTMRAQDVLVDLVCESAELVSVRDCEGEKTLRGQAHRGFLKSAQRLAGDLHELVARALRDNPGYELAITGHSLGGGVATLLALLWARVPQFRDSNVRAWAFAAPCAVCATISQAPFTRKHVTSIVTGDDVVSRLGLATFKELQRAMVALAQSHNAALDDAAKQELLANLPAEEDKLFCGGKVWWLSSREFQPHPVVEIDPVQELNSIELFDDIFAVHLPSSYLDTLSALDEASL
jgi:hypothetical protein